MRFGYVFWRLRDAADFSLISTVESWHSVKAVPTLCIANDDLVRCVYPVCICPDRSSLSQPSLPCHRSKAGIFTQRLKEPADCCCSGFPMRCDTDTDLACTKARQLFQNARERTLIAVKPDGVQRRLVGQIIQRFEQRGFKLVGLKMVQASHDILSEHYGDLRTKPFFHSLLTYMSSGPVVVMVWEGHDVVQGSRKMVGQTNPAEAPPGTIRGDFSVHVSRNVVHASDSQEGAQKEIQLWFQAKDLLDWDCCDQTYTTEV
ncbi:Nucleoside diphosphate kinase, mitochondrial [Oryzias melastigma]|uniref:Nucleoside diphosphate kinase B n=1 Tax=Oryzias melastigma TaxID=30732 RepID=A0A834FHY2_ORYME|nr:Nucleoside diphosphate kinase, mitochondrial [Oryzias melastigma]